MIHNTSTLSYAFDEAVTELIFQGLIDTELWMSTLCSIRNISGPSIKTGSLGELDLYDEKPEGAEASTDRIVQQFTQEFSVTPYSKIIDFSEELVEWDMWDAVEGISMQLGQKAFHTIDYHLSLMFNNATSTVYYQGEDDNALAANAHTNADAANSQDNLLGNSFDYAGLKDTRLKFRQLKGYEANTPLAAMGDELIYPLDLEEDAWQLLQTALKPASANNDRNFFAGRYTGYAWHRLSSATNWGMMDSRLRRQNLRYYNSRALEVTTNGSWRNKVRSVGAYLRYVIGFVDWRWIIWNTP